MAGNQRHHSARRAAHDLIGGVQHQYHPQEVDQLRIAGQNPHTQRHTARQRPDPAAALQRQPVTRQHPGQPCIDGHHRVMSCPHARRQKAARRHQQRRDERPTPVRAPQPHEHVHAIPGPDRMQRDHEGQCRVDVIRAKRDHHPVGRIKQPDLRVGSDAVAQKLVRIPQRQRARVMHALHDEVEPRIKLLHEIVAGQRLSSWRKQRVGEKGQDDHRDAQRNKPGATHQRKVHNQGLSPGGAISPGMHRHFKRPIITRGPRFHTTGGTIVLQKGNEDFTGRDAAITLQQYPGRILIAIDRCSQ